MPKFYLYNDVKLPKRPETEMSYAAIFAQPGEQYLLVYDEQPFVYGDAPYIGGPGAIYKQGESLYQAYHTLEGADHWEETSLVITPDANGYAGFPYGYVWNNVDILSREDGVTVMYEGSEPVALPDAPAIVGFGWTEDAETVMGKTLTVTEGEAVSAKLLCSATVDEGALRVQWYHNGAEGHTEQTDRGAVTSVLEEIPVPASGAATWQCVVTNSLNGYTAEARTGVATLAVRAKPLPGCAVRLLGLILGRLFGGQRKGHEPVLLGYGYNGVLLPELPEWDRTAYPYVLIFRVKMNDSAGTADYIQMFCTKVPMTWSNGYLTAGDTNTYLVSTIDRLKGETEWGAMEEHTLDKTNVSTSSYTTLVWTEYAVYYTSGLTDLVYMEPTEPVPVWAMPVMRPASYNGVELPELPEWDKAAYPYALITEKNGTYTLHCLSCELMYVETEKKAGNIVILRTKELQPVDSDYAYRRNYRYCSSDGNTGWCYSGGGYQNISVATNAEVPVWSDCDILNEDGTVYLAASAPEQVEKGES